MDLYISNKIYSLKIFFYNVKIQLHLIHILCVVFIRDRTNNCGILHRYRLNIYTRIIIYVRKEIYTGIGAIRLSQKGEGRHIIH